MFKVDNTNEKKQINKKIHYKTLIICLISQKQRAVSWLATLFSNKVFVQYRPEWSLAGFNSYKVQCI